jgi:GTP-binding protein
MRAQTELAVEEADVSLFIYDAREGITPLDEVFAALLRRRGKPVIVAANKAEGKAGQSGIGEAYKLGLGEPIPISGEHGEGMAELYAAMLAAVPRRPVFRRRGRRRQADPDRHRRPPQRRQVHPGQPPDRRAAPADRPRGRHHPRLDLGRLDLWDGRKVRLVDTAGLRKKAKVQEKLEKLSTQDTIRAITFAEVVVLVMDATHPFEIQDLQIADLTEREGRALVFVLAKWDLVEDPAATLKAFREHAERMLPSCAARPWWRCRARPASGVDKLMPAVLKIHKDWSTKVKTRDLNDWLQMAMQRHPPPAVSGKRIKPKYMAQTKARPPTFVLFSSRADQMPEHYRRYLINSLRESFDLPGVPLRITIKSGANPYADGEAKGHSGRGKREFERREREEERIRASRNTVKKSKRLADEAAAKAAAEAGLPPVKQPLKKAPKPSVEGRFQDRQRRLKRRRRRARQGRRQVGQEAGAPRRRRRSRPRPATRSASRRPAARRPGPSARPRARAPCAAMPVRAARRGGDRLGVVNRRALLLFVKHEGTSRGRRRSIPNGGQAGVARLL